MKTPPRLLRLASFVLAISTFATLASAATFTVHVSFDAVDTSPGDGICATSSGDCTLRAAVMEANALSGPDTIRLTTDVDLTILPDPVVGEEFDDRVGDLDIMDDLTIVGNDSLPSVRGPGRRGLGPDVDYRIFDVVSSLRVEFASFVIEQGHTDEPSPLADGGSAVRNGSSHVSLSGILVRGNTGVNAVFNAGMLDVTGSVFDSNAIGVDCIGTIFNVGEVQIRRSRFINNVPVEGCSVLNNRSNNSKAMIVDTTFVDNVAEDGVLTNFGEMTILRSTISGNQTDNSPVRNRNSGFLTLINSTISGNSTLDFASAIENQGTLWIINSTITDNTHDTADAAVRSFAGNAFIQSSIIAGNVRREQVPGFGPDCRGAFISLGNNFIGAVGDFCSGFVDPTDQVGTIADPIDPLLGPLQDNGGFTSTHALLEGSPAVDAIVPWQCVFDHDGDPNTKERPLRKDQRLMPRRVGGGCDIGAFEVTNIPVCVLPNGRECPGQGNAGHAPGRP